MINCIFKAIIHSALRLSVVLLLSLIGVIYFLGETTVGLQTLIQVVAPLVPGKLRIEQAEGNLFSAFSLKQISYQNTNLSCAINTFHFDWTPAALYQRQLKIHALELSQVRIQTHAATDGKKTQSFEPQSLRFLQHIIADQVVVTNVEMANDTAPPLKIARLTLKKTTPELITFHLNTFDGELQGTAMLNWTPAFTWSLALKGANLNPGTLWTDWPGKLNFALYTEGQANTPKTPLALTVNLRTLRGTLRNYPLTGLLHFHCQNNQLTIERAHVKIADAEGDVSGNLTQNWGLNWNIHIPNLATVLPKSQGNLSSHGKISGPRYSPRLEADIQADQLALATQKIRALTGKIDLTLKSNTPASLTVNAHDLQVQDHKVKKIALGLTGQVNGNHQNWLTHLEIAIANQRYMRVLLTLPKTLNQKNYLTQPIFAVIHINFPDLSTLQDSVPEIKNPRGKALGTLQLRGSLSRPSINGEVKLTRGNLGIPKLGIELRNVNLRVGGDQSGRLNYSGQFQSGGGAGQLAGTTDLSRLDFPTEMTLRGSHLEAVNLPEYKIIVTPDLKLHLTKLNLRIEGKLTIPKAELTPKDFRQTVTLPDDVVFVGEKQTHTASLLASMPTMQLTVKIDNKAFIHYQDLTTTLGGSINFTTGPNHPATATGELYTSGGTYHAYGQDLNITEGRLIYTGGMVNNPGLNIKAVRQINTVTTGNTGAIQTYTGTQVLTVGVQILGTIEKPAITLFSQPAGLGQDDILSYLLLGIPRSQASLKDSVAILNATSALNIGGGASAQFASITKKLQTGLGLTELNVASVQTFDPTANQNAGGVIGTTSLVLGKKIANNLYLHYSVSLFSATPVTILNLRYQFSKHWSVQSETSTIDNGADILYSLERD